MLIENFTIISSFYDKMSIALPPASGTGKYFERAAKSIRLVRQGCTNRPFFHISVTHVSSRIFEETRQYFSMHCILNSWFYQALLPM